MGWIGTIFVEPAWRGQGLGRAITQSIIGRLDGAGCRTLVLVATNEGRQLYERMGFEVQTQYRILQAVGLPPGSTRRTAFGPSGPSDLPAADRPSIARAPARSATITRIAARSTGSPIDAVGMDPGAWGGAGERGSDEAVDDGRRQRVGGVDGRLERHRRLRTRAAISV